VAVSAAPKEVLDSGLDAQHERSHHKQKNEDFMLNRQFESERIVIWAERRGSASLPPSAPRPMEQR
jgi:hypothetical protein